MGNMGYNGINSAFKICATFCDASACLESIVTGLTSAVKRAACRFRCV